MAREDKKRWRFPMYRGTVGFGEDVTASVLSTHLAACLRDVGAWKAIVDCDRVTFAGSAMGTAFGSMRNVLAPFGSGELEIDPVARKIRYRLRVVHLLAIGTVAVCCQGAILLAVHFPPVGIVLFLPFAWALVVGGSLSFGIHSFTGFLQRSISSAPKVSTES